MNQAYRTIGADRMLHSTNTSASYFNNMSSEDRTTACSAEPKYRAGCWALFHPRSFSDREMVGRRIGQDFRSQQTRKIVSQENVKMLPPEEMKETSHSRCDKWNTESTKEDPIHFIFDRTD